MEPTTSNNFQEKIREISDIMRMISSFRSVNMINIQNINQQKRDFYKLLPKIKNSRPENDTTSEM